VPGKTYFYRVRSVNDFAGSSSYSNVASAKTLSTGEIILDNDSDGVTVNGNWSSSSAIPGFFGTDFLTDSNSGKGSKSVRYRPDFDFEGDYYVYARWTKASNRATNVPIDIVSGGDSDTVSVDQRNTGGSGWVLLGKFHFAKGTGSYVQIRNAGTNGVVVADAIRFLSAK
jgi:hypothetical protein